MVDQVNIRVRDKPVEQQDLLDTVNREVLPQLERLRKTLNSLLSLVVTEVEGDPEGVVLADQGSMVLRSDGGAGSTLYVKESGGTGEGATTTGWVAK
jgi:hypothetical protein